MSNPIIDSKAYKALEVLGKILIPGTLVALITRVLGIADETSNVFALSAVIITAIILFLPEYFRRLLIVLLASLCVILGFLLTSDLTSRNQLKKDPWIIWMNKVQNALLNCKTDNYYCISNSITKDYPQNNNNYAAEKLINDLRAGTFLLTNDTIFPMLDKLFGIKKQFLGTGFALSNNDTPYYNARIAEFLIPNLPDSNPDIGTWSFRPIAQNFDKTLKEIILKSKPFRVNNNVENFRASILNSISQDLDYDKPAVVRISQLTLTKYSGSLGREEAKRVFSLHLGSVWNLKISELTKMSGYVLKPDSNDEKLLFIWVYLPSHPDQVVPATWNKIIEKISVWVNT